MKARDIEEEEEEEEVEEEVEELEEEEEEISIKAETPQNTPPSIVLAVTYDGKVGKALVKLYDPR
jgi:replicative DNA polymerase I (EC 2.7.7.7)